MIVRYGHFAKISCCWQQPTVPATCNVPGIVSEEAKERREMLLRVNLDASVAPARRQGGELPSTA